MLQHSVDAVVVGILTLWLFLTVVHQVRWKKSLPWQKYDQWHLIPIWTFFAPRPGCTDYHLVYRTAVVEGEFGAWREVPIAQERPLVSMFWNPRKRIRKSLIDMAQTITLVHRAAPDEPNASMLTIPYLALLNYVDGLARRGQLEQPAVMQQFSIVETDGFYSDQSVRLIVQSAAHAL